MDCFIGEIVILPFHLTPKGFAPCQGQTLPISQYTALFSLIGTNFGGNGKNTFALPDYRDQAPPESQYFIALQGIYPERPDDEQ